MNKVLLDVIDRFAINKQQVEAFSDQEGNVTCPICKNGKFNVKKDYYFRCPKCSKEFSRRMMN